MLVLSKLAGFLELASRGQNHIPLFLAQSKLGLKSTVEYADDHKEVQFVYTRRIEESISLCGCLQTYNKLYESGE
jgi:hypothetical protein